MNKIKFAFHPGEFLGEELLARGWTQKQFANAIGKRPSELNELIKGKRNISSEWAILIATAFEGEVETWVNMQSKFDCYVAQENISKKKITSILESVHKFANSSNLISA